MKKNLIAPPSEVICEKIAEQGNFPNNPRLPLLLYKNALASLNCQPEAIEEALKSNHWKNAWRDTIYTFHHYHSNTHEILAIYHGYCNMMIGGPHGKIFKLEKGDALILPAGVSHCNVECSKDFRCIGAYPSHSPTYDMNEGKAEEIQVAKERIQAVPIPSHDPLYGTQGLLIEHWRGRAE